MRTPWRRASRLRQTPWTLAAVAVVLLLAAPAFAQQGNCTWKTQSKSFNGLHQRHRPRLVTRHDCCGGFDVAFGECGSKRILAGVVFGVGMAIAAVNFLAWLFPGA
jgi:hypothetical protein